MTPDQRERLRTLRDFPELIGYLHDELDWPIGAASLEDLTYEYSAEELGIDDASAARILEIKRLRPLTAQQPWGIFFVSFEPKRLPVVALRRILSSVAIKKRASASAADRLAWRADDLLFISSFGDDSRRQISFAHFTVDESKNDLPTLKVLGWDDRDTPLHLDSVAEALKQSLVWPENPHDVEAWRARWRSAFSLQYREVITTSRGLALRLAQLARGIRERILAVLTIETEAGPVTRLMSAFKRALIHDLDEEDFADMYAQTIAYGLLSARVVHPTKNTADDLARAMPATTPFLKELMETFLTTGGRKSAGLDFDELGVSEVVELLDAANMEAVLRDFGDNNPQEDPVIHFYELFLKEYDAKRRMQRGVFYTPRPVVTHIVRSVHELLISEFGLSDGLADIATWAEVSGRIPGLNIPEGVAPGSDFVTILDPATGTGTFLVEAIDIIHEALRDKWRRDGASESDVIDLWNEYVPSHLLPRLHGYELLMAPYAIAHLKIGLKLHETGYRFGSEERARVYLTNALEPASDLSQQQFAGLLPALAHEARAVDEIKRTRRFTVVVGNPPYSGISSNMTPEMQRLIEPYKQIDGRPLGERKVWLQDDYVKFFRLAQNSVDSTGAGVLGYITNHGYLDNPTFRGMRQSILSSFSSVRILDLHGNALKKECAPGGGEDSNVFDIRQGVAVFVGSRGSAARGHSHLDLWGSREHKYEWLLSHSSDSRPWLALNPVSPYYFLYPFESVADPYDHWAPITNLMPAYSSGVITARDELVLDYEPEPILSRIERLRDPRSSDEVIRAEFFAGKGSPKYPPGDSRGWSLPKARKKLRDDDQWRERVRWCMYRPFDRRSVYLVEWMVDWSRPEIRRHLDIEDNVLLVFPRNTGVAKPWNHAFVSREPILGRFFPDSACITYMAPALMVSEGMFATAAGIQANGLGEDQHCSSATEIRSTGRDRLAYVYAVLNSPSYRKRYVGELRTDFPRIPPCGNPELLRALTRLGNRLIDLHLLESAIPESASVRLVGDAPAEVNSVAWTEGTVWLDSRKRKGEVSAGTVGFSEVDESAWLFEIGGYQVCQKWLADRRGRRLSDHEIRGYAQIVGAVTQTLRIMDEIDDVISLHGGWPDAFCPPDEASFAVAAEGGYSYGDAREERSDATAACELSLDASADGLWSDGNRLLDD